MDIIFSLNWAALLKIAVCDILLGLDNAVVIALACAKLPANMRTKAILGGTVGAIVLRAVLLVCASFVLAIPYVKLGAGAYLLFIGFSLLSQSGDDETKVPAASRVLAAIKTIIVADLFMASDNVIAVASASESAGPHAVYYSIAGVAFSIPVIIFGASLLAGVMQRFPIILWLGGGLLGWVGAEMLVTDGSLANIDAIQSAFGSHTHLVYQAVGFVAVILAALGFKAVSKRSEKTVAA